MLVLPAVALAAIAAAIFLLPQPGRGIVAAQEGCTQSVDADIVLMLDRTGSMSTASLAAEHGAADTLLGLFAATDQPPLVGVGAFPRQSGLSNSDALAYIIRGLTNTEVPAPYGAPAPASGLYAAVDEGTADLSLFSLTNLESAVNVGYDELTTDGSSNDALILFSDGSPTSPTGGSQTPTQLALAAAAAAKTDPADPIEHLITISTGTGTTGNNLLAAMATSSANDQASAAAENADGDHFFITPSGAELEEILLLLGDLICETPTPSPTLTATPTLVPANVVIGQPNNPGDCPDGTPATDPDCLTNNPGGLQDVPPEPPDPPTPTSTATRTSTATGTATQTSTPPPPALSGNPLMSINVFSDAGKTQLSCARGPIHRTCGVPAGAVFSVDVLATTPPSDGYAGYSVVLQYASGLTFKDQPGIAENRLPGCLQGSDSNASPTSGQPGKYTIECKITERTTYNGALVNAHFTCPPAGGSFQIDLVGGTGAGTSVYMRPDFYGILVFLESQAKGGLQVADAVLVDCAAPAAGAPAGAAPAAIGEAASGGTPGGLYYADTGNNEVKRVTDGIVHDVAGGGTGLCAGATNALGDGCLATQAVLSGPRDIHVEGRDLYIADTGHCLVRHVDLKTNVISTVAGSLAGCGSTGDGGPAAGARLNSPRGLFVDGADDTLYIADTLNCRVRAVDLATGVIEAFAGSGTCGFAGDGGAPAGAQLNQPHDVHGLLPAHDIVIADTLNHRIRIVDVSAGQIRTIAGTGVAGFNGDGSPATARQLDSPEAVSSLDYVVLLADTGNDRVRAVDVLSDEIITLLGVDGIAGPLALTNPKGVTFGPEGTGASGIGSAASSVDDGGSLSASNGDSTIVTAGVGPTGDRADGFEPSTSCGTLPSVTSSIDWALPALLLGAVIFRRRLGSLFTLLRSALRGPALDYSTRT